MQWCQGYIVFNHFNHPIINDDRLTKIFAAMNNPMPYCCNVIS